MKVNKLNENTVSLVMTNDEEKAINTLYGCSYKEFYITKTTNEVFDKLFNLHGRNNLKDGYCVSVILENISNLILTGYETIVSIEVGND